jgi:4-amino-4-deoxy-L-arabinose transferase-like glycosyltransferase
MLLVIYAFAWPLDPWAAAIALLFAAFSPLDLAMARRAWPDELLSLCSALIALLLVRACAKPANRRAAVAALALGAYATLVKETGALLLAFAALLLAISSWRARGPTSAVRWLLGGLAALAAAVGLTALAFRGFAPVWGALSAMQRAAVHNKYVLQYQTGDVRYYARGLALLQPLPMLLGFAGAAFALKPTAWLAGGLRGRAVPTALVTLGWMTLVLASAMTALPQKNLRFLSPIYPLLFLLAGALIVGAWRALAVRMTRPARAASATAIAVALIGAAWLDHARFVDYFVTRGIADLAVPWFTR